MVLPVDALPHAVLLDHEESPIFIGHYWMSGDIVTLPKRYACVDYSVAKSGPLFAYLWDGEMELDPEKFIAATNRIMTTTQGGSFSFRLFVFPTKVRFPPAEITHFKFEDS